MTAITRFACLFVALIAPLFAHATTFPEGFTEVDLPRPDGAATWNEAVGITFTASGRMYVWERTGRVWIVDDANPVPAPFMELTDEVLAWRDHGMLGFALHPGFEQNGYVYAMYVVDPYHMFNCDSLANGSITCNAGYNTSTSWLPNDPASPGYRKAPIGRVVRYQAIKPAGEPDYRNATQINYSSRKVLIGETTRTGPKNTGFPILYESHGIGSLVFGKDGTLLISAGDGASYVSNQPDVGSASETYYQAALTDGVISAKENVGALRAQLIDSLSGKVLRVDPDTGDGLSSNPYYDAAAPRAARSRVWARGVRNPYRMSVRPETGSHYPEDGDPGVIYLGDVGWTTWEDVHVIKSGGRNLGWPLYEGLDAQSLYPAAAANVLNQDAPNPLAGGSCPQYFTFVSLLKQETLNTPSYPNPCNTSQQIPASRYPSLHTRPVLDYRHTTSSTRFSAYNTSGNAVSQAIGTTAPNGKLVTGTAFNGLTSTGGVWFSGTDFPADYLNTYFHGDYGGQWLRNFTFDQNDQLLSVREFAADAGGVVALGAHPNRDGLYYIAWTAYVRKVSYAPPGGRPPVAVASATPSFGASPLNVSFSSLGSNDPDGGALTYLWDFGDGTSSTAVNPQKTYTVAGGAPTNFDATLTVRDPQGLETQRTVLISVNNTPPTAAITSPVNATTYSMTSSTNVNLTATIADTQTPLSGLYCQWQQVLYHNEHEHSDPFINSCSTSAIITPIGCDGETYSYGFRLWVTDPQGLKAFDEVRVYPACPGGADTVPPNRPTNVSATAVGASQINLSWTAATDNGGGVVAGYRIFRNGVSAGTTGGTTYADTGLPPSTQYSYTIAAYDNATPANASLQSTPAVYATTLSGAVSPPLTSANVGAVAATGSYSQSGSTYTMGASGADIWGTADEFRYAYQPLNGDGSVTARVVSLTNTNPWAKAGVMIRESLSAGSRHAMVVVSTTSGAAFQYRTATGGASAPSGTSFPGAIPLWVRIVRQGNLLSGYTSTDGQTWIARGSLSMVLPASIYIGLAATSHNDGTVATAVFDGVSMVNGSSSDTQAPNVPTGVTGAAASSTQINLSWSASTDNGGGVVAGYRVFRNGVSVGTPTGTSFSDTGLSPSTQYSYTVAAFDNAPTANQSAASSPAVQVTTLAGSSTSFTSQNIGAVAATGSYSEGSGTFTLGASGADIWGTADEFRYAYQTLSGDGSITARVVSLTNTNAWAKAGVMIRESLAAGSRHGIMAVTSTSGTAFQYRAATSGTSAPSGTVFPGAAPHWVRIVRTGTTLTGFTSTDGSNWTSRGSVLLSSLPASIYIGLAATSHLDGTVATAVFDSVTVVNGGGDTLPPTVPTGVTATPVSSSQINLGWAAATDNGGGTVAGYRVFRNGVSVATPTGTSYSDSGLAASTQYSYTIAAFDNAVPANQSAASSPAVLATTSSSSSPSLTSQDIGAVAAAGSYSQSGSSYTLAASGADIWDAADEFRFAYQTLSGDGTITARLVSLSNVNTWTKAGLMIRETLTAGSRHATMFVSVGKGAAFQYRSATGGASAPSGVTFSGITAPYWVRLVRSGTTITGYTSPNGTTWTSRGSVALSSLAATVYVGVAATSHLDGTLTTAVVDNLTIAGSGAGDTTPPTVPQNLQGSAQTSQSLTEVVPYGVNTHPHSVFVGDFNEDGIPDLVASNSGSNNGSILTGSGTGTFNLTGTVTLGNAPKYVAVGDLNGDGHQDLVSGDQNAFQVGVLLGNGNGTFQTRVAYAACTKPHEVALADLNADGKLDVVVPCHGSTVVSVFLGNGNGTLQAKVDYQAGAEPHSVVIGDYNEDGKPDLAVALHGANVVAVLRGNGNGTFQSPTTFAVGVEPHSIRAGDLNGDGNLDLVTANDTGNNMSVLLGNGNGTFATRVNYAAGVQPKSVAVGDISGDGLLDVIVSNTGGNYPTCCATPGQGDNISIFYGNGDGTFAPQVVQYVGLTPFSVIIADMNLDGAKDVVTANYHDDTVGILITAAEPRVNLTWQASTDAGAGVAGYRIYRNGGATAIGTSATTAFQDLSVTAGNTYAYTVSAYDAATPANESAKSTVRNVTVP